MEYYIYITNQCNLNCKYCSVLFDCKQNNMPLEPTYSLDCLSTFIDKREKNNPSSDISVCFFGGEPTLNFKFISDLMYKLETKLASKAIKFILHTNGLLLKKIPTQIAKKIHLIMHSINYEKIPQYGLKDSYFSEMIENLQHIREVSSAKVLGRFTITECTSLYTEIMQLSHFYDFVYWQIQNCDNFVDFKSFYATYTFELNLVFDYWFGYFKQGIFLNFVPFLASIKFMLAHDRDISSFACGYGRNMIYIQTDGKCYSCCDSVATGHHAIGDIYNGIQFESISLLDLRCGKCRYMHVCMGRCGRMHKEFSKRQISKYCTLNKYMFNLFEKNILEIEYVYGKFSSYANRINNPHLEATEFTP